MKALLATLLIAPLLIALPAYASDIEREVREAFGEEGLRIYRTLDGSKPAEEIMRQADVPEETRTGMFLWFKEKAKGLNEKSTRLYTSDTPSQAIPYAEQALELTEKVLGKNHIAVTKSLNYIAELYKLQANAEKAEKLYLRTLGIYRNTYGNNHQSVATVLTNLAQLYAVAQRFPEAESAYREALDIFKKVNGKEHASVVTATNNLALLFDATGKLSEAEPLYREATSIAEKVYGGDHPAVASSLNNLGLLYYSSGKYLEAEPLYLRALGIYEKSYGTHPAVATAYNNLALLYSATGMHNEAEKYYRKALKMDEELYGKEHVNVMSDLNNLAALYKDTNRLDEAEPLYLRSLEIGRKALGEENPVMAAGYNNLALLYYLKGRLREAKPIFEKSLAIVKKTLGEEHPDVASWMTNLAMLHAAEGDYLKSHELLYRALSLEYRKREDVFNFLPEDQKLSYMNRTEGSMHAFLSLTAMHLGEDNKAALAAFNTWLRWKGAVMERQLRYMSTGDQAVEAKLKALISTKRKLAKLRLEGPGGGSLGQYVDAINFLEKEKRDIEADLSRLSKDFAIEKTAGNAAADSIAALLPVDSVYLDFAYIRSYNFRDKKPGDFRYAVFVLIPGKEPRAKLIDLGGAKEINGRIKTFLEEMKSPAVFGELPRLDLLGEDTAVLHRKLIAPLRQYIAGKKQLFISPDGNLNLIPFEVFQDSTGRYLIEDYQITYVTAGRDIVRFADETTTKPVAVLMADPDYRASVPTKTLPRGGISHEIFGFRFPNLPDTRLEADGIERALMGKNFTVMNYKGAEATEDALFKVRSPRILHLATHGYFLKDARDGASGSKKEKREADSAPENPLENPMFRSGIVLAGANTSLSQGKDYGIVSAEKVLGLELRGTELVVLSACDTGVGEVERGEGVFGLKRAFILSGAKSLVMSLWGVPSSETREVMTEFYRLMSGGTSKAEALRLARLKIMKEKGNPFYWSAFILVGKP